MQPQRFENPLAFPGLTEFLEAILNIITIIAVPIVVFFLIYAGFMYVIARGNPEKIQVASKALLYGVIGGVVLLGATAIKVIVVNLVNAF